MPFFESNILAEGTTTVAVERQIELARWSSGNALLIGGLFTALALYAVVWMYRREARGQVTAALRWTMVSCRLAVLVLLGLIGLEPLLVSYKHNRESAYTLVLLDESASMSLSDHYRMPDDLQRIESVIGGVNSQGAVRADVCERLLSAGNEQWLRDLAAKNDVKIFSFGDGLSVRKLIPRRSERGAEDLYPSEDATVAPENIAGDEVAQPIRLHPDGAATDLGLALRGAIDSVAGASMAGIVLLSDGRFNRGETPEILARFLKHKRVSLFAIGVGDPAEPINVRVAQVAAPRSAFKNDPFSVTVHLEAVGLTNEAVEVELIERLGDGAEDKVVGARTTRPDEAGRLPPAIFERKVSAPGEASYIARVAPLPYEAVTSDNRGEVLPAVRILDDKMRVLVISGAPGYDYRFLTRMLERDETVDLSTWLQSADVNAVRDGNTIITELPSTQEEIGRYDALILMDCNPREFGPLWGSTIEAFVSDHGGGLLYAAGNKYTGNLFRSPKMKSLIEILPIVPDPEAEIVINELGHYQTKPWPILIPEEAASDPILRQSDNALETKAIWSALGNVFWHYPVRRAKPVAETLMQHSNPRMVNSFGPHALFATQFVGAGRTAYLGINSTWRWRRYSERHFNRFWIQTLRFLVEGKLLGGTSRGRILTSKDQYELGESIVLTARALDEQFKPLMMPQLELQVQAGIGLVDEIEEPRGQTRGVTLAPVPGRDGFYKGRFVPDHLGTFRLVLSLPGNPAAHLQDRSNILEKEIVVSQPDIEMRNTAMDRTGLESFVRDIGGNSRYLEIDEAPRVADLIEDHSRTFIVRGRPKPLWDNQYVLVALMALLTLEWILRKRAKLL